MGKIGGVLIRGRMAVMNYAVRAHSTSMIGNLGGRRGEGT